MMPPPRGDEFFQRGAVTVAVAEGRGGDARTERFDGADEEGLDHGDVANDDGNEGFADGPATGSLGAVGTGLEGRLGRGKEYTM